MKISNLQISFNVLFILLVVGVSIKNGSVEMIHVVLVLLNLGLLGLRIKHVKNYNKNRGIN